MKTKFKIPRNVKRGLTFLGLELKGWVLYVPTTLIFGGLSLLIPAQQGKFIGVLASVVVLHFAFQTDEKTGKFNINFLADYWKWYKSKKNIEPIWRDVNAREKSINISVVLRKKEEER